MAAGAAAFDDIALDAAAFGAAAFDFLDGCCLDAPAPPSPEFPGRGPEPLKFSLIRGGGEGGSAGGGFGGAGRLAREVMSLDIRSSRLREGGWKGFAVEGSSWDIETEVDVQLTGPFAPLVTVLSTLGAVSLILLRPPREREARADSKSFENRAWTSPPSLTALPRRKAWFPHALVLGTTEMRLGLASLSSPSLDASPSRIM